jgi:hypothetical protein
MAIKPLNTPSIDKLAKIAANLVDQEITRIIGPEGAIVCLKISGLLQMVLPLYQQYFDMVDQGEINLETIQKYFSERAWAMLGTPQRKILEKCIKQEVEKARKQIAAHMFQLDDNDRQARKLSPAGQQALAHVLLELTGEVEAREEVVNG